MSDAQDARFMASALALGRQGAGRTAPNPSVGAILVQSGTLGSVVVGAARTQDGGRPHAERVALKQAGSAARGATLYVSLEPCSHVGRTPPCVDAVIAAGIGRAVVATTDPNPAVAGEGLRKLEAAGIEVSLGLRGEEARRDLAGHVSRMCRGRPHVRLKLAVSADGGIGREGEGQIAISSELSRRRAHLMRAESDAIAVGINTMMFDNPQLTCRLPGMAIRSPARVIFDTKAQTPPDAAVFQTAVAAPVIVVCGHDADPEKIDALSEAGADCIPIDTGPDGRVDPKKALALLAGQGMTTVMVEGGARLAACLLKADLVDEIQWIDAPTVLGGHVIKPFGGKGPAQLAERFVLIHEERLGGDTWRHYWRKD
ncbi:MAG: bifunctional diaminohydroxyphosphoribosylaminopyrimidine deaminase/5-amino-6-(5-phosphoribosylamino)uracil reductase RibD [Pseudomonadota bacterium]